MGDVVFRPSEQTNVTVGIEHALTEDQTLASRYRRGNNATDNLGVGGFNAAERALRPQRGSESSGSRAGAGVARQDDAQ